MIDFQLIVDSFPKLLRGTVTTLEIAALGTLIGILFGTTLGLGHVSKNKFLRFLISIYVTVVRGTPMLIQIAIMFYFLPQIGLGLPRFWAATLAIGLNSAAYISQIVKSGIQSVGMGQIEAARVMGFSHWQITRFIILPQAFAVIFPALGNELITLVKDSSLASTIGVVELTKEASQISSATYDYMSIYLAVACIYLILTFTLSQILNYVEKRITRHVTS